MNKIPSRRHELQENFAKYSPSSRRGWRGRTPSGRGFTITPNAIFDHNEEGLGEGVRFTFELMRSHAHNKTGELVKSRKEVAKLLGRSESTARRRLETLEDVGWITIERSFDYERRTWNPMKITVHSPEERYAKLKPVETIGKIDPTPGVNFEPIIVLSTSLPQTESLTPPTPQGGSGVCESRTVERERGHHHHHHHHHHPRQRQRCSGVLSAFQLAAAEVMRLCGVAETNWRMRDGIAAAVALHVESRAELAKRAVEPMVIAWRDYLDDHHLLRCPLGMEAFFVLGAWCDRRQWRYDPDVLKQMRRL